MYARFFSSVHEQAQQGIPFATATFVCAEKPISGRPDGKAIITMDGVVHDWIKGSCAQLAAVKQAPQAMRETSEVRIAKAKFSSKNGGEYVYPCCTNCEHQFDVDSLLYRSVESAATAASPAKFLQ